MGPVSLMQMEFWVLTLKREVENSYFTLYQLRNQLALRKLQAHLIHSKDTF